MIWESRIRAKLAANQPALITTLHFADASLYEMVSLMGFDGIWLDLEHHSHTDATAAELIRAARVGGTDVVARPAKGEFMRMGRLLESGARAIMYPRCASAEEAAEVVRWAKFAPQGERGVDTAGPDNPYIMRPMAEYLADANYQNVVVVQLEEPAAIARAEEIAAVPGVDVLFLGPGDFSVLIGKPGEFDHPEVLAAQQAVADAARNTGKHWGRPSFSVEMTAELIEQGARFICHKSDFTTLKAAYEQMKRDFAPLGFTFRDPLAPGGR